MANKKNKLKKERKTIEIMIKNFCKHHHNVNGKICSDCYSLTEYANLRLDICPYGENKHVCSKCPIHCYKPEMRENIREVMRYSGPRMIYSHPYLAFRHLFLKARKIQSLSKGGQSS